MLSTCLFFWYTRKSQVRCCTLRTGTNRRSCRSAPTRAEPVAQWHATIRPRPLSRRQRGQWTERDRNVPQERRQSVLHSQECESYPYCTQLFDHSQRTLCVCVCVSFAHIAACDTTLSHNCRSRIRSCADYTAWRASRSVKHPPDWWWPWWQEQWNSLQQAIFTTTEIRTRPFGLWASVTTRSSVFKPSSLPATSAGRLLTNNRTFLVSPLLRTLFGSPTLEWRASLLLCVSTQGSHHLPPGPLLPRRE